MTAHRFESEYNALSPEDQERAFEEAFAISEGEKANVADPKLEKAVSYLLQLWIEQDKAPPKL